MSGGAMTPQAFVRWRKRLDLTQQQAADLLGLSKSTIQLYERGSRRDDGRPVEIPTVVELACAAIALGVRPGVSEGARTVA